MKKDVAHWQMGGFILTAVLGTLLHFLFDWTGESPVAALVSAVNESIWEHMKLLFWPMVLFAAAQYGALRKEQPYFWQIKLMGALLGLTFIPVLYYTYTGALGVSADWFNITIFFLAAGAAFWLETKLFLRDSVSIMPAWLAVGVLLLIGVVFAVFTFLPPKIPLFADPLSNTYGFWRNVSKQTGWA